MIFTILSYKMKIWVSETFPAQTEKGMNLRLVLMISNHQYECPLWFSKEYEAINTELEIRNNEIFDFFENRSDNVHRSEKGMSLGDFG